MSINRNKVLKAAQKHIRKRNWDKALREYLKLVEDDPTDMRSLLKCGDLYVKIDQIPDALESYKAVADHYAQKDMYEKAIAVYKQAQRLDTEEVALHHAIGECYFRLGRLKDAVRSFHQAQRMYKERGDHDNQRQMLEHMVRIDPEDVGLRVQLAERYTKDNLKEAAVEAFSFCAERLEEEGRHDELLQVLERTLYLTPQRQDLRKKTVRLYLDRQDNKAALKHLQICFRELPDDVEVMELLAQTFERLGRDEKAVLVLQELGPLYKKAGRTSDATNLYRRILRLDPDNAAARKILGVEAGPDSDMLAGSAVDTGALGKRQNTPMPTGDSLDGVEFLDDEIEFLDDDLVPESAPAARSSAPPQSLAATPERQQGHVDVADEDEFVDLTDDIELVVEPEPEEPQEAQLMDLDDFEAIESIEPADPSQTVEGVEPVDDNAPESEIRSMLSECDVFLKYGLYDKAVVAIDRALEASPNSIYAHEQLLALHQTTGETKQEYRTLITLAELTQKFPLRVYDYLAQALDVAPNPAAVHVRAEALGVDLNAPPPTQGLEELSVEALEPPETFQVDIEESGLHSLQQADDDPESLDEEDILFLDDDDPDGVAFLLEEDEEEEQPQDDAIEDVFNDIDQGFDDALAGMVNEAPLAESTDIEELDIDELDPEDLIEIEVSESDDSAIEEVDFIEEIDSVELGFDDAGLNTTTDSEIVADDDLGFDDVDIVEMDFDDDDSMDDVDFGALDDVDPEQEEQGPGFNSLFADVEADELFDDLFGDMGDGGDINLGGDDPMGEMAEIDFFIQQGLTEEAEEAIQSFDAQSPNHPGIDKRRNQLQQVRSGLTADENPFGSRSLSQKFNPTSLESESNPELANFDSVVNSNLELGVAYRDMGLIEEAIEEFQQATDDPEAAISAHFNIALCKIDLGEESDARNRLGQILEMEGLSAQVASTVRAKIDELETRAS